jgi:hypothetical protein
MFLCGYNYAIYFTSNVQPLDFISVAGASLFIFVSILMLCHEKNHREVELFIKTTDQTIKTA